MTPKELAAMQQALDALEVHQPDPEQQMVTEAIIALREALAEQAEQEHKCKDHPDAPHGFDRNASHNAGRYVCECEGWEPDQAEQEPVAWFVQYKNRHEFVFGSKPEFIVDGVVEPLYAAPVRKKDLTDDELNALWHNTKGGWIGLLRAVIAADREKNK